MSDERDTLALCGICDWSARGTDSQALAQAAAEHARLVHPDQTVGLVDSDWMAAQMLLLMDAVKRLCALEVLHHYVPDGSRCCCGEEQCYVAAILAADPDQIEQMDRDAREILRARAGLN